MYSIVSNDGLETITVVEDGQVYVADHNHPGYKRIVKRARNGKPVAHLFNIAEQVVKGFEQLSERVVYRDGQILLDDEPIEPFLENAILDFYKGGVNFTPLVKFLENVAQNPSERSRKDLYRWLNKLSFHIDDDGMIIGYKGVAGTEGNYTSISSGTAFVNGKQFNGKIPYAVGDVVTMPRSEVNDDSYVGCSTGLHVGTKDYATKFSRSAVLTVVVNPRDVVSVPTDCNDEKMRVCRYVIGEASDFNSVYVGKHHSYSDYDDDFDWGSDTY